MISSTLPQYGAHIAIAVVILFVVAVYFLTGNNSAHADRIFNALLAEHALSLIELTPENPTARKLKDAVVKAYRISGFPNYSEELVAESFNARSRIEQLNILAMAFSELGWAPMLRQEQWRAVKNPFIDEIDDKLVKSVTKRLSENHTARIGFSQGHFAIKDWGITDNELDNCPSSTRAGALSSSFQLPGHTAVLVDNPPLPGPIAYLYALYVCRASDNTPQFIVTAEKQFSFLGIEDVLKDSEFFSDGNIPDFSSSVVIGVHSDRGHENHGASSDYADRDKFVKKALLVAKEKLGVSANT